MKNILLNKIFKRHNYIIQLIYFILCFLLFIQYSYNKENIQIRKLNLYTKIKISIKEKGEQRVLYQNFNYHPEQILINDALENNINDNYTIELTGEEENNITIIWNETLQNYSRMFYGLSNITKINFIDSNDTNIEDMSYMFNNCTSLISLNFGNLNISNINDMKYMFYNCNSLKSLILTNFNTSNVNNMEYMFSNCTNLILLDISKFETYNVESMEHMFENWI